MPRFKDVEVGNQIYSVVYGVGNVVFVLEKEFRVDGYFMFEVAYKSGERVHYTEDGRPGWCRDINSCSSTIYYRDEIDLEKYDRSVAVEILKRHQIQDLRKDCKLEMISPAGHWIDASLMPDLLVDKAISHNDLHLFREMKV